MKVAFIVPEFPSLSQTFVLNQITGLMDRGIEVDIFANVAQGGSKIHEDVKRYNLLDRTCYHGKIYQGMPTNKLPRAIKAMRYVLKYILKNPLAILRSLNIFKYGRKAASFNLLFQIIPFLNKGPYDIFYCHFGPCGNLAVLLKELGAISGKIITAFHGYDLSTYLKRKETHVYERLFKKGDLFLPISRRWQEKLIELGCKQDKIVVHRMGINVNKFASFRRTIRNNGKTDILTVARLVEKKGVSYAIKAVAEVLKQYPGIQYRIAGDGPMKKNLIDLIERLGVRENVHLLGWKKQSEILKLMSCSDILLAPSVTSKDGDQEGIPVALMEAMAMGLPVVSTHHSGIPELIENGVSGFLVPERNVDALFHKLKYLVKYPHLWPELGRRGRNYVQKHYDINKLNDRLVKIYRGALTS